MPEGALDAVIDIAVEPKSKADQERMGTALAQLAAEDPSFSVKTDEESGQTIISGVSELHVATVVGRLRREFAVEAHIGAPQAAYREAITRTVEHTYTHRLADADHAIHIAFRIEPNPGRGHQFTGSATNPDESAAVLRGVVSIMNAGPLIGFPIVDVKFELVSLSCSGGDGQAFEGAGRVGFREAIQRADPQILEPIMRIEVVAPFGRANVVRADLVKRRAVLAAPDQIGSDIRIAGTVPLSMMFGYAVALGELGGATARHEMAFECYAPVPHAVGPEDGGFSPAAALRA